MKHFVEVTIPEHQVPKFTHETCDLCGKTIKEDRNWDFDLVRIEREVGSSYPEGGSAEKTSFSLCVPCWEERLFPAAQALGIKPEESEHYW
jgi:hypothetical protein